MAASRVLVTDFDGTLTRHDFYHLALESLIPPEAPNHWEAYRTGAITHFQALQGYFATIRAGEADVLAVVDRMELEPLLPQCVRNLRAAGWEVVVASAGCAWYIRRLLSAMGVELEVHANPGRFVAGQGLLMELPTESPFLSPTLGIDKAGIVRQFLAAGQTVAFAGDGYPDAEAAQLVPAELRFAKSDLAHVLRRQGLPFRPFDVWSDVARELQS